MYMVHIIDKLKVKVKTLFKSVFTHNSYITSVGDLYKITAVTGTNRNCDRLYLVFAVRHSEDEGIEVQLLVTCVDVFNGARCQVCLGKGHDGRGCNEK